MLVAGCTGASTWSMAPDDLDNFKYDCRYKERQLTFLLAQLPRRDQIFKAHMFENGLLSRIIKQWQGTYTRHAAITTGRQKAIVKFLIFDIIKTCDWHTIPSPKCIQILDDTPHGFAIGKRCYDGKFAKPFIDWWEPID